MFWHYLGNKFLTILSNMFTNLNLTDMETCFKVFRTEVIKNITIEQNGFALNRSSLQKPPRHIAAFMS